MLFSISFSCDCENMFGFFLYLAYFMILWQFSQYGELNACNHLTLRLELGHMWIHDSCSSFYLLFSTIFWFFLLNSETVRFLWPGESGYSDHLNLTILIDNINHQSTIIILSKFVYSRIALYHVNSFYLKLIDFMRWQ